MTESVVLIASKDGIVAVEPELGKPIWLFKFNHNIPSKGNELRISISCELSPEHKFKFPNPLKSGLGRTTKGKIAVSPKQPFADPYTFKFALKLFVEKLEATNDGNKIAEPLKGKFMLSVKSFIQKYSVLFIDELIALEGKLSPEQILKGLGMIFIFGAALTVMIKVIDGPEKQPTSVAVTLICAEISIVNGFKATKSAI